LDASPGRRELPSQLTCEAEISAVSSYFTAGGYYDEETSFDVLRRVQRALRLQDLAASRPDLILRSLHRWTGNRSEQSSPRGGGCWLRESGEEQSCEWWPGQCTPSHSAIAW
jgi:hypothetical protein